jgi:hypothetical protein
MARANAAVSLDDQSAAILYEGANMSQLSILFRMDDRVLKEKMHGLQPCGKRGNASIYDVAEVAARCGKLTEEQVDAAMRRLNHKDLPKELTKEYWAGLKSRHEYMKNEGDLWPTNKVIAAVGDIFKLVKMSALLTSDAIERNVELSDRQREIVKSQMDGMLLELHRKIIETFKKENRDVESTLDAASAAAVEHDDDDL